MGVAMRFITFRLKSALTAIALVFLLVAGVLTANAAGAADAYWTGKRALPIYSVGRDDNKIAISFDCAWGVDSTDEILRHLEEKKVKATFFTVQFWAEKYPEYLKKVSDAGHEVGTHSATHSYMSKLSESEIKAEFETSCAAIEKEIGRASCRERVS